LKEMMMKLMVRIVLIGSAALAIAGVAQATEPTVEQFNAAFMEANEARKMAGEMGHEWRDTAKILKKAQETAESGDLEKALELVAQAQFQGEAGVVQAEREASLWEGRVIR